MVTVLQSLASTIKLEISTEGPSYTLGLQEVVSGTAKNSLEAMKTILNDIETVAGEGAGKEILLRIRNTAMSDRHVVQKKFECIAGRVSY